MQKKSSETHPLQFRETSGITPVVKQFQRIFAVCPVDKTTHNLGIVCKSYYQYVESTQISTKAYSVVVNETVEEILARHRKFNDVNGYIHVDRLPYQYGVPKFHKVPPGWRFIAGVCGEKRQQSEEPSVFEIFKRLPHEAYCSTTDASKWLSGKLQLVMELLQMKDNESF